MTMDKVREEEMCWFLCRDYCIADGKPYRPDTCPIMGYRNEEAKTIDKEETDED